MATQIASLYARIGADLSGLERGLASARGKLQSAGKTISGVGQKLTMGLTVPIVALGTKTAMVAADFESQMNVLSIAARSAGTGLDVLQEAAIQVGGDTQLVGINAAEAAESMTEFYKAGLSTTDIFGDLNAYMSEGADLSGALRSAIDLQAASELSLAEASDVVSIAMATFGISAEGATGIADNFVRAADASVASVGELADAMKNVGPTAAAFGWSMEDVNTGLALLSQRGIKGAEAGTALKSMMTNIMRPTKATTTALKALNVSLYDQKGALKDLPVIIGELGTALDGVTEQQRNEYIQTLAGTYGMKAMNTLLAEGVGGWNDMESAIANAASVQDSAAARTKGLSAAWETLQGVMETLMIQVGLPLINDFLNPLVRDNIIPLIEYLSALDPQIQQWGIGILAVTAAAGPLLMALGVMLPAIGALLSPVGLVVAGVAALTAAFVTSQGGIGEAANTIQNVVANVSAVLQERFGFVIAWVQENMPLIQSTIETVWSAVQTVWETVLPYLQTYAEFVFGAIGAYIDTTLNVILGIIKAVMLLIQGDWQGAWDELHNTAIKAWEGIQEIIGRFREFGEKVIGGMIEGIKAKAGALIDKVKGVIGNAIDKAKALLGISSPSKVFREMGKNIGKGMVLGLDDGRGKVVTEAARLVNDVVKTMETPSFAEIFARQFTKGQGMGSLSLSGGFGSGGGPGGNVGPGGEAPLSQSWGELFASQFNRVSAGPTGIGSQPTGGEMVHKLLIQVVSGDNKQSLTLALGGAKAMSQTLHITAANSGAII